MAMKCKKYVFKIQTKRRGSRLTQILPTFPPKNMEENLLHVMCILVDKQLKGLKKEVYKLPIHGKKCDGPKKGLILQDLSHYS